jgi:hypothetical protein
MRWTVDKPPFAISLLALSLYSALTPEDRAAINTALAPLLRLPYERWPEAGAVSLDSPELQFFVKVDRSLRAIIRPTREGKLELVDLIRHEWVKQFTEAG